MSGFGFISGLAFACAGWATLSVAMDRHYAEIYGRGKEASMRTRRKCRLVGTLALLATYAVSVKLQGWTVGSVLCLGTLVAAGLSLVLLLSYAPQRVVLFGVFTGILAFVLGLIWLVVA